MTDDWGPEVAEASRNGRLNTWLRGSKNGRAKISAEDAAAIRGSSLSERALARRYGISNRTIGRIRHGEIWV
jgi:hypothetical protein